MMKKGFLKTMEVFIAVSIVMVFLLYTNNNILVKGNDIQVDVLSVLSKDNNFRNMIFDMNNVCYDKGSSNDIIEKIDEIFPDYLNYKICVFEDVNFKITDLPDVRIYVESYYFSSKNFEYSPRVAKIFYWSEE